MKKMFIVLALLFAVVFIGTPICANTAHADQGFYGSIYSVDDDSEDVFVEYAVVKVYRWNGTYIGQTTASICGYYTITVPDFGFYYAIVDGSYNLRVNIGMKV